MTREADSDFKSILMRNNLGLDSHAKMPDSSIRRKLLLTDTSLAKIDGFNTNNQKFEISLLTQSKQH